MAAVSAVVAADATDEISMANPEKKTYSINAGELPIDDTFRDTRLALTANWQQPLSRLYTANIGVSVSREYDYTHFGVNGKLSRDFNQRNTTLSAGLSAARDRIDPVGKVPAGLTPMLNVDDLSNRGGHETKTVVDAVLEISQVISRNLVMQLNYSYSNAKGYLTDPYKLVSVVDSVSGEAIETAPTPDVAGPSHMYLFELRPDERTKHSLFGQAKYYLDGKVLDFSYRYMRDDWEIDSHTFDIRFRWPVSKHRFLEPHLRYYSQSAADFYTLSINQAEPLPQYISADYRLGDFDAVTAGLKYGWQSGNGNDRSLRLELYRQSSNISSTDLLGSQAQQDNVPDLNAVILQFGYRFGRQ